jgi:trigger factor
LKVTVERIPDSQVVLNIEVEPERVQTSLDQAYKRLAPRARIPGFRPGKAPRALVERHYGRETLLHEALDKLIPEIVSEAIEAEKIDLIDRPDVAIDSLDPVVLKATVPVRPTVHLGDYRAVRVERGSTEVAPEEIDKALEELRERYASIEPVERAIEDGDVIRADIRAVAGERELVNQEDAELTGLETGEATFEVEAPEELGEELAGQTLIYTVTIKDVKTKVLSDLDDEFAKEVGESFPTLAALRERIEQDIRTRQEHEADHKLEEAALDKLVEGSTIDYPPQLVEREIERMLRDQGAPEDRRSFEKLLQRAGVSEDRLREQYRPMAIERVRRSLALSQLREAEQLSVTAEEIQAELDRMAEGERGAQLRGIFDSEPGRQIIERDLLNRRVVERLRAIALGEAPELPAPTPTTETSPDEAGAESDAARQEETTEAEERPA